MKPSRYTQAMIDQYVKSGQWAMLSWPDIWDRNARDFPDREAVVDSRLRLTWAQARQWINRLALGLLELGFKKDEVIVIQLPNSVELPLLRLACEKAGILCAPVLRTLRHREMEYILKYTGARGIVIPPEFRGFDYLKMIEDIRPNLPGLKQIFATGEKTPQGTISVSAMLQNPLEKKYPEDYLRKFTYDPREISWISHTSGSTGFPKFVEIPTAARMNLCEGQVHMFHLNRDDVIGALSPATGGPNTLVYWSAALAGAKVVMMEHFEAEAALQLIEREKITAAGIVPTMFSAMLRHPDRKKYNLSSMRFWYVAAGTPSLQQVRELEESTGAKAVQFYGAVDWGGSVTPTLEDSIEVRALTAGKPAWGGKIRITDDDGKELPQGKVGEVWGAGPSCIGGYYKDEAATWQVWTRDGWYRTGDLGRIDDNGNLVIAGRKKDMIKRGGQNIYPIELEKLLITHPDVAEAAVVAMPDPEMLERACLYVVPKSGKTFTSEKMQAFLTEKGIAAFKIPERLEIIDKMPMVAADQKIDKKSLREDIRQKLENDDLPLSRKGETI